MKSKWKDLFFLIPGICMLAGAVLGIALNPPIPHFTNKNLEKENKTVEAKETQKQIKKLKANKVTELADGSYTASAQGFGGAIVVSVHIKKGKIVNIQVLSHEKETPAYYQKAKRIISEILKKQSTHIDTVSGATFSSTGILQAVQKALLKASGKKVAESKSTVAKTVSAKKSGKSSFSVPNGKPKDGVYTGKASCDKFGYQISLKAKFKNGNVVALYAMKMYHNENPMNVSYMKKAWKKMVQRILKNQNKSVDVVSGATYSSQTVWAAYRDAYRKAAGGKTQKKAMEPKPTATTAPVLPDVTKDTVEGEIVDGTYLASALCSPDEDREFEPYTLYAQVTFQGGRCVQIDKFSSTQEKNRSYYQKAANGTTKEKGVVTQILEKQGTAGISAVSKATCSSLAICNLYRQAIIMASNGKKSEPTSAPIVSTPSPAPTATEKPEATKEPAHILKDGSYTQSTDVEPDEDNEFEKYSISANIIFKDNLFVGFENISISDSSNQFYINRALNGTKKKMGLNSQLIGNQKEDADTVTGATCTSKALIFMYKTALTEALVP